MLYPNVVLGNNVIIHAGSVIGADGLGYRLRDGKHVNFPQVGTVVIESDVEIGANTCIDRAALGETHLGTGTNIDNQVHIAHNVRIGAHSLLCGQVGIGGSTVIGDYVTLALAVRRGGSRRSRRSGDCVRAGRRHEANRT